MKKLIALLVLTSVANVFAQQQERVLLNGKTAVAHSSSAILVRTSKTPEKVEVTMQVPMANSFCDDQRIRTVPRMCTRTEQIPQTRTVCQDVVVTTGGNTTVPQGPRYNNPGATRTERRCHTETYYVQRNVSYDCSYTETWCAHYATNVQTESDKVKIRFKNLPALGGSEEEEIQISARQRMTDGSNVDYDFQVKEGQEVIKKGILFYDSYIIQPK